MWWLTHRDFRFWRYFSNKFYKSWLKLMCWLSLIIWLIKIDFEFIWFNKMWKIPISLLLRACLGNTKTSKISHDFIPKHPPLPILIVTRTACGSWPAHPCGRGDLHRWNHQKQLGVHILTLMGHYTTKLSSRRILSYWYESINYHDTKTICIMFTFTCLHFYVL